jgi:hypothetical protein
VRFSSSGQAAGREHQHDDIAGDVWVAVHRRIRSANFGPTESIMYGRKAANRWLRAF